MDTRTASSAKASGRLPAGGTGGARGGCPAIGFQYGNQGSGRPRRQQAGPRRPRLRSASDRADGRPARSRHAGQHRRDGPGTGRLADARAGGARPAGSHRHGAPDRPARLPGGAAVHRGRTGGPDGRAPGDRTGQRLDGLPPRRRRALPPSWRRPSRTSKPRPGGRPFPSSAPTGRPTNGSTGSSRSTRTTSSCSPRTTRWAARCSASASSAASASPTLTLRSRSTPRSCVPLRPATPSWRARQMIAHIEGVKQRSQHDSEVHDSEVRS